MKPTSFLTMLYGIFVLLDGIMGLIDTENQFAIFESLLGLTIFICSFFMIKEKRSIYYLSMIITIFLFIYYSYIFATTTLFSGGVLAAASIFIFIFQVMKILRMGEPD